MWKAAVMAEFEIILRSFTGNFKDNHEKIKPFQPASGLRFETGAFPM
jgi:hypothetical protein